MTLSAHPLWLAGFRPFFAQACLAGMALPALWVAVYSGILALPDKCLPPIVWHAHEMFYGFGWAVLGGFLLTSTKNWVNVRGYHGGPLMFLAFAWLGERVVVWFGGFGTTWGLLLAGNLFVGAMVILLLITLLRHRNTDSYREDNRFFLVALPLFLVAKNLMLAPDHFAAGSAMTLALFRLAFLVMLERTVTQFMKGIFQVDILRDPRLDNSIKVLGLALVFEPFLPAVLGADIALFLALLLVIRFAGWKPLTAARRLDVGVMHLGYLAIVAQLVLGALAVLTSPAWVGTLPTHVFTFGAMGLVIPAMIIRIANGHTGRKVIFDGRDRLVLKIMAAALVLRVVAPQLYPAGYLGWLILAAACWVAGYGLLAWRYIPYLWQARVDGKEH